MSVSRTPIVDIVKGSSEDHPIDVPEVLRILSNCLEDCSPDDRCYGWLIAMGLFPSHEAAWKSSMMNMHQTYRDFVDLVKLQSWESRVFPVHYPCDDYGVDNNSIMSVIHGDVVRTGRMIFFLPRRPIPDDSGEEEVLTQWMEHVRRIERLLYVFATLNSGTGYMQGFNELITPLYYVCVMSLSSIFDDDIDLCESVVFNMFQELMTKTHILEFYTTQDKSSIILHRVKKFEEDMHQRIPNVGDRIKALNIHPLFYCLRWFTLLFAQEHELPGLLLIWDGLFAHFGSLIDYAACVAMGHLKLIEPKLLQSDYGAAISALQNMDVGGKVLRVIQNANEYWAAETAPPKKSVFARIFGK